MLERHFISHSNFIRLNKDGGIFFEIDHDLFVADCTFHECSNSHTNGGGIHSITKGESVVSKTCFFHCNTDLRASFKDYGQAIFFEDGRSSFSFCCASECPKSYADKDYKNGIYTVFRGNCSSSHSNSSNSQANEGGFLDTHYTPAVCIISFCIAYKCVIEKSIFNSYTNRIVIENACILSCLGPIFLPEDKYSSISNSFLFNNSNNIPESVRTSQIVTNVNIPIQPYICVKISNKKFEEKHLIRYLLMVTMLCCAR